MHCFVTGAAAFVGEQLVSRLLSEGHQVTLLVPDDQAASRFQARGGRVITGLPEAFESSDRDVLEGVDVVFHCDAHIDLEGTEEAFRRIHVVGTRRLVDAAVAAKVPRLVYLSSQVVAWDGHELLDSDESVDYPDRYLDPYSESRAEAERLLLGAARAGRLETVAIRPGWTWGPGDNVVLPQLVSRAMTGSLPLVGDGEYQMATTYVDHAVDAMIRAALVPGISGRVYYVSDDVDVTVRAFIDLQLGALGLVAQYRRFPQVVARAAAAVVQATAPLLGAPLPLIRLIANIAAGDVVHNTEPARTELGYAPYVSLDEGLAELQGWAQDLGGASAVAALRPSRSLMESS